MIIIKILIWFKTLELKSEGGVWYVSTPTFLLMTPPPLIYTKSYFLQPFQLLMTPLHTMNLKPGVYPLAIQPLPYS